MKRLNDLFDRFADAVAERASRAWFFAFCKLLVVAWLVQGAVMGLWTNDLWHLELNSPTTAITFLLVALLHNTQHRTERAIHEKLDVLMAVARERCGDADLCRRIDELTGTEAESSQR